MTVTTADIGRICVKRDNPQRQFQIVALRVDVTGGIRVTLQDLLYGTEFTITDTRTYAFAR